MWNQFGLLRTWEIGAAVFWTVYCVGSWREIAAGWRSVAGRYIAAIWVAGFVAMFALLQVARLPLTPTAVQSIAKSAPTVDTSKLSKLASARD